MKTLLTYSLLGLCSVFFLPACGNTGSQTPDPPAPLCYVLCDFSKSHNGASLEKIRENAMRIFQLAQRDGYHLKYYDIRASQYEGPFFEYTSSLPDLLTPSEERALKDSLAAKQAMLDAALQKCMAPPHSANTCIITAIDKVANAMANDISAAQKATIPVRIAILSDMLEYCRYDFGRINIEHPPYRPAFMMLSRKPRPSFSFKGYNVAVAAIAASDRVLSNADSVRAFWAQVFQQYEYAFTQSITPDIPAAWQQAQ